MVKLMTGIYSSSFFISSLRLQTCVLPLEGLEGQDDLDELALDHLGVDVEVGPDFGREHFGQDAAVFVKGDPW